MRMRPGNTMRSLSVFDDSVVYKIDTFHRTVELVMKFIGIFL